MLQEELASFLALAHAAEDSHGGHSNGRGRKPHSLGQAANEVAAQLHEAGISDAEDGVPDLFALKKVKESVERLAYFVLVILPRDFLIS